MAQGIGPCFQMIQKDSKPSGVIAVEIRNVEKHASECNFAVQQESVDILESATLKAES